MLQISRGAAAWKEVSVDDIFRVGDPIIFVVERSNSIGVKGRRLDNICRNGDQMSEFRVRDPLYL